MCCINVIDPKPRSLSCSSAGKWPYYWTYYHPSYCAYNCWVFGLWMWEARSCHPYRYEFLCWRSSWGNENITPFWTVAVYLCVGNNKRHVFYMIVSAFFFSCKKGCSTIACRYFIYILQDDMRCNCKEGQTQSFAFLPIFFLDSVPWLLRTLLYSSLCDNVYYSCRCLLLGKKCLVGVGILGICIPILRQSTSVQDELKGEKVPSHRFRSWLCLMMVCMQSHSRFTISLLIQFCFCGHTLAEVDVLFGQILRIPLLILLDILLRGRYILTGNSTTDRQVC